MNNVFSKIASVLLGLYVISVASSMAGMELFGYSLVLLAIVAALSRNLAVRAIGLEPIFAVFFVVVLAGAINAITLPMKFRIDVVGQLRWILLLYALTLSFAKLEEWQERFLKYLIGAYVIAAIYGVIQSFTGLDILHPSDIYESDQFGGAKIWRARGFFSNTMSFAYCLGQVFSFSFAWSVCRKPDWRAITATFILGLGLLSTFTRGAWLGIALSLLVMAFLYRRELGLKITAGLVAVMMVGAAISPTVRNRLTSLFQDTNGSQSVSQRYDLWRVNWQMFLDHPLVGVGYGYNYFYTHEYNEKVLGHAGFEAQTHNNYLQVLAGCGLPGFALWLTICGFFFVLTLKLYWREKSQNTYARALALGSLGAQVFFHVGGLTQSTFFDAKPLHILLCGWALVAAVHLKASATSNKTL